ncbi:hypothetical protein C1646_748974 [Rhizophagus diaphanus]|nr:hypothetical protein C1646_748974 [Rhizophagus diaphanus] [Rhizophagus sp. MUCL 43196]
MEGMIAEINRIEETAIQRTRSYLRCANSEDLSSCLPSLSFHPVSTNAHMKPLLCPKCPSTDMELEEEVEMDVNGEVQPDTSSKKRTNEDMNANLTTPKKKAKKLVRREDSSILKKLIKELIIKADDDRGY